MILARYNYDVNGTSQNETAVAHHTTDQVDNLAEAISAMKRISNAQVSPRSINRSPRVHS